MKKIGNSILLVFLLACAMFLGLSVYSQDVNPNENSWLPFFGLAFSLLFWANLFLLLILFLRKKVLLIVPLVAIVYAYPSVQNYYKIFPKSEFSEADIEEIKLLSYNVRVFDANKNIGGNTKDKIFTMLKGTDANIMCFQEFYYADNPDIFKTKSIIQDGMGLKGFHENFTHHLRGGFHYGVATFTSYPIIGKGNVEFESDKNNACIYTDLIIETDTVRVYNAHFSSIRFQHEDYELIQEQSTGADLSVSNLKRFKRIKDLLEVAYKRRALQLQEVLDHIYSSPYPVVLAGDFNDTPVSYCYAQTRKYLTDSFVESGSGVGNTYIGDFPSFRIDYVFHSEELESAAYKTLEEELSDHRAVYTKLRVKPV